MSFRWRESAGEHQIPSLPFSVTFSLALIVNKLPEKPPYCFTLLIFFKKFVKSNNKMQTFYNNKVLRNYVIVIIICGETVHITDAFIPIWQGAINWIIAVIFVLCALIWAKNDPCYSGISHVCLRPQSGGKTVGEGTIVRLY